MAEALARVKKDMGRDAVILSTRSVTRGAVLGMGGKPVVEITAAASLADVPAPVRGGTLATRQHSTPPEERPDGGSARSTEAPGRNATTARVGADPRFVSPSNAVAEEIAALRGMVTELLSHSRRGRPTEMVGELQDAFLRLTQNAVAEDLALSLVEAVRGSLSQGDLRDPALVRGKLAEALMGMTPTAGPIAVGDGSSPRLVALVGPTGVGKTTTIAKLAAHYSLRENRRVGLITLDNYRIAAVEQLRTYADIMSVPLDTANTPGQLADAVARMEGRDLILFDTAGRSQRDGSKIADLRALFESVRPHETHLVLSGTCGERVLHETIERFGVLGIDRVIFTKLDESLGFGVILSCLQKANARLSYITTGQSVPDDIEVADRRLVADMVLRGGLGLERIGAVSAA